MKENLKSLTHVDESLLKFLRKKYPPLIYQKGQTEQEFLSESIFRAGQIDVVDKIEKIIQLQQKG